MLKLLQKNAAEEVAIHVEADREVAAVEQEVKTVKLLQRLTPLILEENALRKKHRLKQKEVPKEELREKVHKKAAKWLLFFYIYFYWIL